jgi:alkanesulfonate monooxygenase SsuD/methylene tetrahydromethanopterin reductase-like flavin-dependent oxidoreductase (luciferase family)
LRFGYGLITCQRYPGESRSDAELYAEALAIARRAEDLGFDSVWTSEHHFADDGYMPSLLAVSAAIAACTERIEIGTGLLLAPLHHPLRLAEDAATVDVLSAGRLILGLGLGWLDWEFEALGVPIGERVARTERVIEVCRAAWGPGLVQPEGVAITPKPAREGGPPIWIGAHVEPAVRRAARLAEGWMAGEPDAGSFRIGLEWIRDELGSVGRDPASFEIAGYWPVFVSEASGAWDAVRPYLHYMEWKYEDAQDAKGRLGGELPSPPALEPGGEEDRELRRSVICGTPTEVAERIIELAGIAGPLFTFIARLYFPGMPREMMDESTRLFAELVVPSVRGSGVAPE